MIYDIAGLRVNINNRCKYTEEFCKEYLSPDQTSPYDILSQVTNEEFYAEKELSSGFSDGYIENICLYRNICKQLPSLDRMLLHAAILQYNSDAYAFLGRSGTGKSTHTRLWLEYVENTKIVNGDKPILQKTKDGFIAYGTPWMGKEGQGENTSAPLKALCFLQQAPQNKITKLTPAQAATLIFQQVLIPEDEQNAEKTLALMDDLVSHTPCFLLECTISQEAVQTSYEALTGKTYIKK